MTTRIALVVGIVLAAITLAVSTWKPAGAVRLAPDNAQTVARGASIYAAHCASCHGRNLEGQTPDWRKRDADGYLPAPPHDQSGHTWHHSDKMLFELKKRGPQSFAGQDYKSRMPAYEAVLSDDDVLAVLSYIKSPLFDVKRGQPVHIKMRNRTRWRMPCTFMGIMPSF